MIHCTHVAISLFSYPQLGTRTGLVECRVTRDVGGPRRENGVIRSEQAPARGASVPLLVAHPGRQPTLSGQERLSNTNNTSTLYICTHARAPYLHARTMSGGGAAQEREFEADAPRVGYVRVDTRAHDDGGDDAGDDDGGADGGGGTVYEFGPTDTACVGKARARAMGRCIDEWARVHGASQADSRFWCTQASLAPMYIARLTTMRAQAKAATGRDEDDVHLVGGSGMSGYSVRYDRDGEIVVAKRFVALTTADLAGGEHDDRSRGAEQWLVVRVRPAAAADAVADARPEHARPEHARPDQERPDQEREGGGGEEAGGRSVRIAWHQPAPAPSDGVPHTAILGGLAAAAILTIGLLSCGSSSIRSGVSGGGGSVPRLPI